MTAYRTACIGLAALVALALPEAWAQRRAPGGFQPPPAPKVEWVAARVALVPLPARHLQIPPPVALVADEAGGFLFGPTPGYAVSFAPNGDLRLALRGARPGAKPIVLAQTKRLTISVTYAGVAAALPVELIRSDGGWSYRVAALLQLAFPTGTLYLCDADQDGWFDDLDVDLVALATGKSTDGIVFEPFTGEVKIKDQRGLLGVNGVGKAGLWPIGTGVRSDYVRHVAEANALRRFLGYAPVGLAEELIALCETHAKYCEKHGLCHDEEPSSPLYTPGGNYAGTHSNVGGGPNAQAAAIGLLKTLWHRNAYLEEGLTRISVGMAGPASPGTEENAPGYSPCASDIMSHGGAPAAAAHTWPADLARDVWVDGSDEDPDPYPSGPHPGPFITLFLPRAGALDLRADSTLAARGGKPLAHDWTDPETVAAGSRSMFPTNDRSIVMIPHQSLEPDTIYDATITTKAGVVYRWSFRTR